MIGQSFKTFATPALPANNDTYSQVVRCGGLLFVSGQLGIDPATRELVAGGVASETRQALRNIGLLLEEAGSSLMRVARCNLYVTDFSALPDINAVYGVVFTNHKPAKTTVEVSRLDKGAAIEIEVIAEA